MLSQGDTFFYEGHLFAIISKPELNPEKVVLAAFTTYETYKDDSCILEAEEHSFCTHKTCISYDFLDNMIMSEDAITSKVKDGTIQKREPLRQSVLKKVLAGAESTERIHNASWLELNNQGIVG